MQRPNGAKEGIAHFVFTELAVLYAAQDLHDRQKMDEPKPTVYYEMNRTIERNDGLGSEVYFSREAGEIPSNKVSPGYTNIKFRAI